MAKTTTFRMSEGTSAEVASIQKKLEALWNCGPVSASSAIRWAVGRASKLLDGCVAELKRGDVKESVEGEDDMFYPGLRELPS